MRSQSLSLLVREDEYTPVTCLDAALEAEISEENAYQDMSGTSGSRKAFVWAICSASALYTSKRLMTFHGYHYPLSITLRFFTVCLILCLIIRYINGRSRSPPSSDSALRQLVGGGFFVDIQRTVVIPASFAAAISVPLLMEGILHMPSLPVLVMLFPLVFAADSAVEFVCSPSSCKVTSLPVEIVVVVGASAVVLYNEYRLLVPGLACGISAILLFGLARALLILELKRSGSHLARQRAYHRFCVMTMVFGLTCSGGMAYSWETIESIWPLSYSTMALMAMNIIAMVGTTICGTAPLAYSVFSFDDASIQFSSTSARTTEVLVSAGSSFLLLTVALCSNPVSYVSWIQIMAFLFAIIGSLGMDQVKAVAGKLVDFVAGLLGGDSITTPQKRSRCLIISILAVFNVVISSVLSFISSSSLLMLQHGLPARYDHAYIPRFRFDIVISMYDESPASVHHMLSLIKTTSLLQQLQPRVIIYTKHPTADLEYLKTSTGAQLVERLPNLGREGGTYLHHIVDKWDELAEQTMFIQAHAHNIRELIPRIESYLVPRSGMLSLGFVGHTCFCGACADRWGWEDTFSLVPALYSKVYSQNCTSNKPILLSYKGQFVASARRIRGVEKSVFQDLLSAITSTDGSHNSTMMGHDRNKAGTVGKDSPSNPHFGFTMERVWALVLQCATEGRVAGKCPSLLSGMSVAGVPEDCQCLDELN